MKICSNKKCSSGGVPQSLENFSKDKTKKDGYEYRCKVCAGIKQKRVVEKNKENFSIEKLDPNKTKTCPKKDCIHQGNFQSISNFHINKSALTGTQTYCMDCSKQLRETCEWSFSIYKARAKRRDISFNLTLEEFSTFWQQPCYYCACEIKSIGIDRVDNSIGYELNNCVSCCAKHNSDKKSTSINIAHKMIEFENNQIEYLWGVM